MYYLFGSRKLLYILPALKLLTQINISSNTLALNLNETIVGSDFFWNLSFYVILRKITQFYASLLKITKAYYVSLRNLAQEIR
jgi:hypothetical protein